MSRRSSVPIVSRVCVFFDAIIKSACQLCNSCLAGCWLATPTKLLGELALVTSAINPKYVSGHVTLCLSTLLFL